MHEASGERTSISRRQPDRDPLTTLRVAVTGHRDLDPRAADGIRRSVGEVIGELVDRCSPARVELVTGVADGADQVVAEVAVEYGCDVHVVLPKSYELYRSELSPEGGDRAR